MSSSPLFDFKAGRVELDEKTGQAHPLAGQGRVALLRSSEDASLLGIQWLPRGSNSSASASEELLLVPGDVEFSHIPQCQTGRVIQMRFHSSGERHLFWLQDAPKGDLHVFSSDDETILRKLNELSNSVDEEEDDEDAMQDEGSELLAGESNLHTDTAAMVGPTSAQPTLQPEAREPDARRTLLDSLSSRLSRDRRPEQQPLSKVITPAARTAHVRNASEHQIADLLRHAEGIASNREELVDVLASPHFAQALNQLGRAVMESPALAQELGLSRIPQSNEELLDELRKAATKEN